MITIGGIFQNNYSFCIPLYTDTQYLLVYVKEEDEEVFNKNEEEADNITEEDPKIGNKNCQLGAGADDDNRGRERLQQIVIALDAVEVEIADKEGGDRNNGHSREHIDQITLRGKERRFKRMKNWKSKREKAQSISEEGTYQAICCSISPSLACTQLLRLSNYGQKIVPLV